VKRLGTRLTGPCLTVVLASAAPATASTIGIEPNPFGGNAVVYRAAPGEANQFFALGQSGDQLGFQDGFGAVVITPLAPCAAHASFPMDPRFAQCPASGITGIAAILGDGPDTGGGMVSTPLLLDGGDDNDSLTGGLGDDLVAGGAGNDILLGEPGSDILDGGPGADDFRGNTGSAPDADFDLADYSDRVAPVSATLDGRRNDGEAGEGDQIFSDVEDVNGGAGGDTLVGNDGSNYLSGFDGNDQIDGGGGRDILDGGNGDDVIAAQDGNPDQVDCGPGVDAVAADAADSLVGCESISLPAVPAPVLTPAPAAPSLAAKDVLAPRVLIGRISKPKLRVALRRGLPLVITCRETCTLRVSVFLGSLRVARAVGTGGPAAATKLVAKFTASGRRALRHRGRAALTVRIVATDTAGNRRVVTRHVTLRR
jgi:hypothetical protein